jgi:hypothetical protein
VKVGYTCKTTARGERNICQERRNDLMEVVSIITLDLFKSNEGT